MKLPVYHADKLLALRLSMEGKPSQAEVARRTQQNVKQPDISAFERGTSLPSIEDLAWLGEVYGKTLMEMLGEVFTMETIDAKSVA